MADHTHIEWTDSTWNPITGCSIVSAGCTNCYAMGLAGTRLKHHPSRAGLTRESGGRHLWTGEVRFNEEWIDQPLRWRKPRRIFVCAHGDLFHEAVPDEWIDRVFAVMALASQHTFQVLTKRPERMLRYLSQHDVGQRWAEMIDILRLVDAVIVWPETATSWTKNGLPNVWLGTSIEDQAAADARTPHLLATPAAVRFVSAEPLLGAMDLRRYLSVVPGLDWVIVGGESGPRARPMHPDWVRGLRDQCQAAGVAFFFKQWGEWSPCVLLGDDDGEPLAAYPMDGCFDGGSHRGDQEARFWQDGEWVFWPYVQKLPAVGVRRVGKRAAGRLIDGRTWDGMAVAMGMAPEKDWMEEGRDAP
ncbi:phage Gp37/Gp68 family protein [Rhodovulum sp. BSW8]|uniref:DUF5131 family protein n=1 Tax=Rhodovulum sp. BSW8 TaxID=2259645 RepID=UPI000DE34011|nr:phage Gp37/Gp68 family protein [Rhodovulum sp. BSW8]RBO52637.1 phage Gp37/Gp68 family protein [Rhodovulum sp. BSW8]